MFSDTHFHFYTMSKNPDFDGKAELSLMAKNDVAFALDIGTRNDDLEVRQNFIQSLAQKLDEVDKKKVLDFMYFSAGIWPSPEEIKTRKASVEKLEALVKNAIGAENSFFRKVVAIGECGLDHHWNPSGVDGRCESDFDSKMIFGEAELFEMQIALAKKMNLPLIIHSRDAFEQTFEIIKNCSYDNGIIHCFSYDLECAKAFLERGWYIALGGGMTYTKKNKMQEVLEMIRYIPENRLLLETDAPYLAPVPMRGKANTPNYICYLYDFIANARGVAPEYLCGVVDKNCKELFHLK